MIIYHFLQEIIASSLQNCLYGGVSKLKRKQKLGLEILEVILNFNKTHKTCHLKNSSLNLKFNF
jgi:hypothetical protein